MNPEEAKVFKKLKFRLTFGLWPTTAKAWYDQMERGFVQLAVDIRLAELATTFLAECRNEEALKALGKVIKDVAQNLAYYRRQHRLVEKTKRRFWEAVTLAKHLGYKVKGHARDYLGSGHYLMGVEEL